MGKNQLTETTKAIAKIRTLLGNSCNNRTILQSISISLFLKKLRYFTVTLGSASWLNFG